MQTIVGCTSELALRLVMHVQERILLVAASPAVELCLCLTATGCIKGCALGHSCMVQAENNVRVTSQVVNDYIKDAVQPRLAFDIPSSWRLFMVSLTQSQHCWTSAELVAAVPS